MASEKQVNLIVKLMNELNELDPVTWPISIDPENESDQKIIAQLGTKHGRDASRMIDELMEHTSTLRRTAAANRRKAAASEWLAKVPAGRYACTTADPSVVRYFRVRHGQHEWAGQIFVDETNGRVGRSETRFRPNPAEIPAILAEIAADVEGCLVRYGYHTDVCGICFTPLSDPLSVELGIGPKCRRGLASR